MGSIRYFKVLDFDAAYSDHCPILVGVQSLYSHDETNTSHRKSPKILNGMIIRECIFKITLIEDLTRVTISSEIY